MVKNAKRARQHLLGCAKVREKFPNIKARLRRRGAQAVANVSRAGQEFSLPALPVAQLDQLRQDWARLMLVSGFSFSTFDTPEWREMLMRVSGHRFNGPGGRRAVGGGLLTRALADSDAALAQALRASEALSFSLDGMTDVNGSGVHNTIVYTPKPFLLATFRMGLACVTAANLLSALTPALQGPLLNGIVVMSAAELEGMATRLSLLCAARLLVLLTESPSNMVALRTRAVAEGHVLFSFGCPAHAANLVAQHASGQTLFAQALRASVLITVFFTLSSRAIALLAAEQERMPHAKFRALRSYSRTRWAAQGATIRAVAANLPVLQHALLENSLSPEPVSVPRGVAAAVASLDVRGAVSKCAPLFCASWLVWSLSWRGTPCRFLHMRPYLAACGRLWQILSPTSPLPSGGRYKARCRLDSCLSPTCWWSWLVSWTRFRNRHVGPSLVYGGTASSWSTCATQRSMRCAAPMPL